MKVTQVDYAALEARLLQHMKQALLTGVDMYTALAADMFGVGVERVTPQQRQLAKEWNLMRTWGFDPLLADPYEKRLRSGDYVGGTVTGRLPPSKDAGT